MADREKVIGHLNDCMEASRRDNTWVFVRKDIIEDALALLKEQERKKGSWDYGTQCSVCKGTIVPPWKRDTRVNFCPWCGADMRDSYEQERR